VSSALHIAAFIAGLAGSAHCFGMCGGMAGALGMRARLGARSPAQGAARAVLYHVGRIGGYASIGALGGAFGHSAHWALDFTRFESLLRVVAGVLTLLVGIRLLSRWNAFAPLERLGAKLWIKLQPLTRRASLSNHWSGALATGLLWGWLPCGLVYSIALMSLTTGSAFEGAALMAAFGFGTLPAMASTSVVLGASWPRLSQRPLFRAITGCALLTFGTWMIVAAQLPHRHDAHSQSAQSQSDQHARH
jgi:uncharacterized protein